MPKRNTSPRHNESLSRLPPDLVHLVRRMACDRGHDRTATTLRCSTYTLEKLIDGNGATRLARDRLEIKIRELIEAGEFAPYEETVSRATVRMVSVQATGPAPFIAAVLESTLRLVGS